MAQNVVDFSGNPSGAGLMDDYLDKDQQNVLTSNSGIQRPSYAVAGTKWLDTSATPWLWKMYDGTDDVVLGTVNPSTHLFTPKTPLTTAGDILVQGADGNLSKLEAGVAGTVLTANGAGALPTYQVNPIGVLTYSSSYTYKKNDIVVSTNEDDETALYKSLIDSNIGNDLSDDTKWEKLLLGGSGVPIGSIGYTLRTEVPEGGAWCDGAEYTKEMFPDIYQMLVDGKIQSTTYQNFTSSVSTNGSCGFFGLDSSAQKFKVPMLKDVYIKAGQAGEMFGAESLPNITGKLYTIAYGVEGSFTKEGTYTANGATPNVGWQQGQYLFDASLSSSTYQDGAKVNPDHVTYRAYVVLYASAAEASVAQAAEFMTALGGKANVDMDNVTTAGKAMAVGWGIPDYSAGVTYSSDFVAPTNGYCIATNYIAAWGVAKLLADGSVIDQQHNPTAETVILIYTRGFCKKGQTISKDGVSNWGNIIFYPCIGG